MRTYFCDPAAPVLPYSTPFYPRPYDQRNREPQDELGEVYGTRTWHGGQSPVVGWGEHPCGTADVWELGAAGDVEPLTPNPVNNLATCCGAVQPVERAGVILGGPANYDTNRLLQENGGAILQENDAGIEWRED